METIRFKGDAATRRRFFVPESFQHPAKMASGLFLECLERYSKPGDTVLDPLAGSGTALLGAMYGRHMVLNELERHFLIPMLASWKKIQWHGPALGHTMGQVVIVRGDARTLPLPDASVAAAITSPPYEETLTHGGGGANAAKGLADGYTRPQVDAVITSPPFEGTIGTGEGPGAAGPSSGMWTGPKGYSSSDPGYTRSQVDAVITSPPFQEVIHADDNDFLTRTAGERSEYYNRNHPNAVVKRGTKQSKRWLGSDGYTRPQANPTAENIGNLRSTAYWQAMSICYAECWRVLRPGGILALVLKGFVRAGVYQNLPGQTEALLLAAGWRKHDEWRRELWALSFWRILQRNRDPAAFDERLKYETVLAFQKPGDSGGGIAAVLTSPPYEGSIVEGNDGIDWSKAQDKDRSEDVSRRVGGSGRARGYTCE